MNLKIASDNVHPTIQFQNVTYSINGSVHHTIVKEISLSVDPGQTLVLLGRSGSGKTTLLKLINRLLIPTTGQAVVRERPTTEWAPIQLRRGIGYVIQEARLFPHFPVAQNVALAPTLENWDASRISGRVNRLVTFVRLE